MSCATATGNGALLSVVGAGKAIGARRIPDRRPMSFAAPPGAIMEKCGKEQAERDALTAFVSLAQKIPPGFAIDIRLSGCIDAMSRRNSGAGVTALNLWRFTDSVAGNAP